MNHQLVARVAYVDPAVGKPLDVIAEFTKYSGRMMPLPDWITSGACRVHGQTFTNADQGLLLAMREAQKRYWHCTPDSSQRVLDLPPIGCRTGAANGYEGL